MKHWEYYLNHNVIFVYAKDVDTLIEVYNALNIEVKDKVAEANYYFLYSFLFGFNKGGSMCNISRKEFKVARELKKELYADDENGFPNKVTIDFTPYL